MYHFIFNRWADEGDAIKLAVPVQVLYTQIISNESSSTILHFSSRTAKIPNIYVTNEFDELILTYLHIERDEIFQLFTPILNNHSSKSLPHLFQYFLSSLQYFI